MVEAVLKSSMDRMRRRVSNVHEAGTGEVGDVFGEREMRIKSNAKIGNRGIRGECSGGRVIGQVY